MNFPDPRTTLNWRRQANTAGQRGRPRTTHPVVLCQRLGVGEIVALLASLERKAPVLISLRDTLELLPFLLAVCPVRHTGALRGVILAYRPDPYRSPGLLVRQDVALRWETDVVGRSRPRFLCPGPGCGRSADSLYLLLEANEFRCRRCAKISYRRRPSLAERDLPSCSADVEIVLCCCRALTQEAGRRLNERASGRRHGGGEMDDVSRADPQALRRRAVIALWRDSGWTVEELGRLFGVSDRTIKRDLRAAREQGEAPSRHLRTPVAELKQRVADMLRRCRTLQESLLEMARTAGESEGRRTWAAATQSRLLREERRLVELLATLEGAGRPRCRKRALRLEPEWLDPELIALAASQQAAEERPAG